MLVQIQSKSEGMHVMLPVCLLSFVSSFLLSTMRVCVFVITRSLLLPCPPSTAALIARGERKRRACNIEQ